MDGEELIEEICKKHNIDTEIISDKDWNNAISMAEEFIEKQIEFAIEREFNTLVSEFGLDEYLEKEESE